MIPQVDLSIEIHLINQKSLDFASIKGYKKSKGWNVNDVYASDFNSNNLNFEIFEVKVLINWLLSVVVFKNGTLDFLIHFWPSVLLEFAWVVNKRYWHYVEVFNLKTVDWILSLVRGLLESWPSWFYWLW